MLRLRTIPSITLKPIANVRPLCTPKTTYKIQSPVWQVQPQATFVNLKSGAAKFKRLVASETRIKRTKRPQRSDADEFEEEDTLPKPGRSYEAEEEQFEKDDADIGEDFDNIKTQAKGKTKKRIEKMLFEEAVNEQVEDSLEGVKNKQQVPFKKIIEKKRETRMQMKKGWEVAKQQEEAQIQYAQKNHLEKIQQHAHAKMIAEAENEFQTMVVNQIPIGRPIYRAMMEMYLDNGNYDRVKQLYEELNNTSKPDGKTFAVMISAYARSGDPETSIELFQQMIGEKIIPTEHTFNQIIGSYVAKGDAENAMRWFKKMHKYDITPSGYSYDNLLRIFPDQESMKKYLEEVKTSTDPIALNFAVAVAGKMQSETSMMNLFDVMKKNNIPPSQLAYNVAIQFYGLKGNTKKMIELYLEMQKYGYLVDRSLIKLMFSILKKTNDVDAVKMLQKQMRDLGITPSPFIYSALIECYSRANDFDAVWNLFQDMLKKNVPLTTVATNRLIDACGFNNQRDKLDQLVHQYDCPKDKYFHKCLAGAYLRCGDFTAAVDVFRTCRQQNVPWKIKLLLPFISRMRSLGLPQLEPIQPMLSELWSTFKQRKNTQNRNDLGAKELALTEQIMDRLRNLAPSIDPAQLKEAMMKTPEEEETEED